MIVTVLQPGCEYLAPDEAESLLLRQGVSTEKHPILL